MSVRWFRQFGLIEILIHFWFLILSVYYTLYKPFQRYDTWKLIIKVEFTSSKCTCHWLFSKDHYKIKWRLTIDCFCSIFVYMNFHLVMTFAISLTSDNSWRSSNAKRKLHLLAKKSIRDSFWERERKKEREQCGSVHRLCIHHKCVLAVLLLLFFHCILLKSSGLSDLFCLIQRSASQLLMIFDLYDLQHQNGPRTKAHEKLININMKIVYSWSSRGKIWHIVKHGK